MADNGRRAGVGGDSLADLYVAGDADAGALVAGRGGQADNGAARHMRHIGARRGGVVAVVTAADCGGGGVGERRGGVIVIDVVVVVVVDGASGHFEDSGCDGGLTAVLVVVRMVGMVVAERQREFDVRTGTGSYRFGR